MNQPKYSTIFICDEKYANKRGEAEALVQKKWAASNLEYWFKNRNVPFNKPLQDLTIRHPILSWPKLMAQFVIEQNQFIYNSGKMSIYCPKCRNKTINQKYNFSKISGCNRYSSGKCNYGFTFYLPETVERIEIISKVMSSKTKEELLVRLRTVGSKGIPDIVGVYSNYLYFIEVKDINEAISKEQTDWLGWLNSKAEGRSFVMRVKNEI